MVKRHNDNCSSCYSGRVQFLAPHNIKFDIPRLLFVVNKTDMVRLGTLNWFHDAR
jgi:hypothetical protein